MYDVKQIPYDYTVEVTNRFKGLDLTDRVPEELWTEVEDTVEEAVVKTILKEISPDYSLEGLMLKLKLQYSGHLMQRSDSFEKTLMRGKIEGGGRRR